MITTDMRKHPPELLEELVELKYEIYTLPKNFFSSEPFDYALELFQNYKGYETTSHIHILFTFILELT